MVSQEFPLVLQLDNSGNPCRWITYEDSAYYYSKKLVAWENGQVDFTLRGGTNATTGKQSKLAMNTIIAVKGKAQKNQASMRVPLTNKTLFRRDHNLCAYCGNVGDTKSLTRDHIQPTSKKGADVWTNVVTACESCNKWKDDRTPEQAGMKMLYVPYEPSRGEYLILQNRRILFDQMQFLLNTIPMTSRIRQDKELMSRFENLQ